MTKYGAAELGESATSLNMALRTNPARRLSAITFWRGSTSWRHRRVSITNRAAKMTTPTSPSWLMTTPTPLSELSPDESVANRPASTPVPPMPWPSGALGRPDRADVRPWMCAAVLPVELLSLNT
jgi:hypothetical protein